MNPIQEAIAKVTGLDDRLGELSQAVEHLGAENALLQRQIEDIDFLNLFDLNHITDVVPLGDRKKTINRLRRLRHENPNAKQAVNLVLRFTLGKGVQLVVAADTEDVVQSAAEPPEDSETNGFNARMPGGTVIPIKRQKLVNEQEESDETKRILTEFWKDRDNRRAFTSRQAMKDWLDGNVTDGERFLLGFVGPVAPYVKLVDMPCEEITDIIYHPKNRSVPVYYKRVFQDLEYDGDAGHYKIQGEPRTLYYLDHDIREEELGEIKKSIHIPAAKLAPVEQRIYHTMPSPLWTKRGRRGIPELFASREWFRVFREFMEDRAAINSAATAIAYKRKIKSGPTGVAQFQHKLGGLDVGYESAENNTEIKRLTRPAGAAIYDSNPAVDLEWMKTDTGAANAKEDARGLLASAGAGVGMFIHYFGEGGDSNLATAQAMELPMVKTFEDWQQWVDDQVLGIAYWVLRVATDEESANEEIDRVATSFPAIITQDVVKYSTAWSQVVQSVAPGNAVVKKEAIKGVLRALGVPNIDALLAKITAEEEVLEQQRQQRELEMQNAMRENPLFGARNGSGNALDSDLKRIASGKPEAARNGPKAE